MEGQFDCDFNECRVIELLVTGGTTFGFVSRISSFYSAKLIFHLDFTVKAWTDIFRQLSIRYQTLGVSIFFFLMANQKFSSTIKALFQKKWDKWLRTNIKQRPSYNLECPTQHNDECHWGDPVGQTVNQTHKREGTAGQFRWTEARPMYENSVSPRSW